LLLGLHCEAIRPAPKFFLSTFEHPQDRIAVSFSLWRAAFLADVPMYVAEFQFRYNNRFNDDIFGTAIEGV
jgi:hypothetical protein